MKKGFINDFIDFKGIWDQYMDVWIIAENQLDLF